MSLLVHTIRSFLLAALIVAGNEIPAVAAQAPGEYEVKAAFLYNFLAFVEWPPQAVNTDTLRVCVLDTLPVGEAFDALDGQAAMGKKLAVTHLTSLDDLGRCHVLFIGPAKERDLPRIIKALQGAGTLTIGDTAGFARQGVIINFYLEQKKVRFEINTAAARRAGLTISAKLLRLAGAVYGVPPGEN